MGATRATRISGTKHDDLTSGEQTTVNGVKVGVSNSARETEKAGETRISGSKPAGLTSGEHSTGGGVEAGGSNLAKETENAGDHAGDTGLVEVSLAMKVSSVPQSADHLGFELLAPMKSTQVSDSPKTPFSTIPESVEGLGYETMSPVKSSKRLSEYSDYAGGFLPKKQTKQIKVFQRRENSLPKATKSWVAERVSWNGGKGCDVATEDESGKNDSDL
jgi:hypothetical protein